MPAHFVRFRISQFLKHLDCLTDWHLPCPIKVSGEVEMPQEGEMDTKKVTVKSIICAVILSLSMPILGLADSHSKSKDRGSRKKFSKFVNGHDARDGKWDRDDNRDWDRNWDRDRD